MTDRSVPDTGVEAELASASVRPEPSSVANLIDRLRGIYRIPITDGLGAAGGEEPDNPNEFVRTFQTSPIQHEAADALSAKDRELAEARKQCGDLSEGIARALDLPWLGAPYCGERCPDDRTLIAACADLRLRSKEDEAELHAISSAIESTRFMDPPDGGDVSLAEQVRRMRAELEAKETRLAALENGPAGLADANSKESLTLQRDSALEALRVERERVKALEEALRTFVAHYPMSINPFLDDAFRRARSVLAQGGGG